MRIAKRHCIQIHLSEALDRCGQCYAIRFIIYIGNTSIPAGPKKFNCRNGPKKFRIGYIYRRPSDETRHDRTAAELLRRSIVIIVTSIVTSIFHA